MAATDINQVIKDHAGRLMAVPGVVGVAAGLSPEGTPCIIVMAVKITPALRRRIPGRLQGHPVIIEETGEIRAMSDDKD